MTAMTRRAPRRASAGEPASSERGRLFASPADIADYVADMTAELERMARGGDLERLADLLRLARDEARRRARPRR